MGVPDEATSPQRISDFCGHDRKRLLALATSLICCTAPSIPAALSWSRSTVRASQRPTDLAPTPLPFFWRHRIGNTFDHLQKIAAHFLVCDAAQSTNQALPLGCSHELDKVIGEARRGALLPCHIFKEKRNRHL